MPIHVRIGKELQSFTVWKVCENLPLLSDTFKHPVDVSMFEESQIRFISAPPSSVRIM
jgi:hypothetical protein